LWENFTFYNTISLLGPERESRDPNGATAWCCGVNNRVMGFALLPYFFNKQGRLLAIGSRKGWRGGELKNV